MGLKKDEYWWIDGANGELITVGRDIRFNNSSIFLGAKTYGGIITDTGIPNPFRGRGLAKEHCRQGERPVKVRIVKVKP